MKESQVSRPDGPSSPPRRRVFFNWLWGLLAAFATIEVGWFVGSILKSRKHREEQGKTNQLVDIGMADTFLPESVTAFPQGQFYLSRLPDGSFLALSRTCTHLGCAVPWDDQKKMFVCPCHGSTFDRTGMVLTAPAMRPLDYYPIRIENGLIRVDISTAIRREAFDPSQTKNV